MKNPSVIAREKIHVARQWIFRWRGLDGTPLRGFLALVITASAFAIFAATVRIRVSAPQQWVERKASIIHLPSEGDGKIWALRAQEGGPFPSRIDPLNWEKATGMADPVMEAARSSAPAYQPILKELPLRRELPPLATVPKGVPVFPRHAPAESVAAAVVGKLMPALYPLDGLSIAELPTELPEFSAPIDGALTSPAWRFAVRLRSDGSVRQAVSMTEDRGADMIANWLASVNFGPEVAGKSEWIGIGVGFTNQAAHGPDAR